MEKIAMILLLAGLVLIVGCGIYHLILNLTSLPGVPLIIKMALIMIIIGIVLLLLLLIWEKVKGGLKKDVGRKY